MSLLVWLAVTIALVVALMFLARRSVRELIHERHVPIDRFKLKSRHSTIAAQLFASAEVRAAMAAHSVQHHVPLSESEQTARQYLREILPKFNLLAYYRVGEPLARVLLNFLYRVIVARKTLRDFSEAAPKGSVVVYVINHRSNVDYVLVAHMLFKFVSLSYAVGEWARVWPLNHLFKWFGAYFIRRRFREPLYHAVLGEFIRTITRNGVTQGFFIEGGLTRDGAFQKPKLGMLDYIVSSKRDASFTAPLYLIPTSIGYDRILEDRVLTDELLGREDRATRWNKLSTTSDFLFKNLLRSLSGRFKRYGYAIVAFGEPILVDQSVADDPRLVAATFEERKAALQALGDRIMGSISDALPITPVPMIATLFRRAGSVTLSEEQLLASIDALRLEWHERAWLLREHSAVELWKAARHVLELRHLLRRDGAGWMWHSDQLLLRDYYADSLLTYAEVRSRGWPERGTRSVRGGEVAIPS